MHASSFYASHVLCLLIPNAYTYAHRHLEYIANSIVILIMELSSSGRYCGNTVPQTIISSESRMWLEYKSSSDVLSAFTAQYEGVL